MKREPLMLNRRIFSKVTLPILSTNSVTVSYDQTESAALALEVG
jgi:hypothetical protein